VRQNGKLQVNIIQLVRINQLVEQRPCISIGIRHLIRHIDDLSRITKHIFEFWRKNEFCLL
jgi:hypothetical protein